MSTPYSGIPSNVSLGSPISITVPADGDPDSAATVNVPLQKLADYIAGIASPMVFVESFDAAAFPPTTSPGWAAPSPRIGTSGFARDTNTPITGTASANRPAGQLANTVSSLGLSTYLSVPCRVVFDFKVTCNPGLSDHLDFYVDGAAKGSFSSRSGPTTESGRFFSPVIREGIHTFDWTFVRGALASVGGEQAKIDNVQLIPETAWASEQGNRVGLLEDFLTTTLPPGWTQRSGANAGSYANNSAILNDWIQAGVGGIKTAGTAATDWTSIQNDPICGFGAAGFNGTPLTFSRRPLVEFALWVPSLTNVMFSVGLVGHADVLGNGTERIDMLYDSALGANWRLRTVTGGAATIIDTGVVAVANQVTRVGISYSTLGVVAMLNGQSGASAPMTSTTNVNQTAGFAFSACAHIESRVAAAVNTLNIDSVRIYASAA